MSKSFLLFTIFTLLNLTTYSFTDSTSTMFINLDEVTNPRPDLPYQIYTEHFIIHYGPETPSTYANNTAEYAEYAYEEICVSRGWRIPPADDNRGGDNRYDIYILSDGYRGVCRAEYYNEWPYEWAPSFIEINRNLLPDGLYVGDLRVGIAHEFSHATQFAYTYIDGYSGGFWFYENCATYIADEIYGFEYSYFSNFWGVDPLNNPELKIDTFDDGLYEYAGFIWPMFLIEWTNNNHIVKSIWIRMGENPGENVLADIDFVLQQDNKSLNEALNEYAVWRYYTGSRAEDYTLKSSFPTAKTININSYPASYKPFDSMGGLGGVNFIAFTGNYDVLNVFMNGDDIIQWGALYLNDNGYNNFTKNIFPLNSNGDGSLEIIKRDINNVVLIPACFTPTKSGGNGYYSASIPAKRAVKFANIYIQENLGGQLLLNNNDEINSGDLRILGYSTYPIKTMNERFSDSNIKKHNNWNGQYSLYYLGRNFPVTSEGDVDQNAQFDNLRTSTVRNVIDGMSFNNGVPINFNDPWYVKDEYDTQSGMGDFLQFPSPYYPTGKYNETSGGVFLNQSGSPLWTPPYYSVKADLIQDRLLTNTGVPSGRYHKFYFKGWTGTEVEFENSSSLETGVVFKDNIQGVDPIVQANLKGTQLTNNINAFNYNGQRKSLRTPNNQLFNIYESMGKTYLENSTDNGLTWSFLNNANPFEAGLSEWHSIDYFPWIGSASYIVDVYYPVSGSYLRLKVIGTNNIIEYLDDIYWEIGNGYPIVPVVAVTGNRILIVSTGGTANQEGLVYLYGTVQQSPFNITWSSAQIVPGTSLYSLNTTIVADKNSATPVFHIAWQENNVIKYCRLTEVNGNPSFSAIETPSANSGFTNHYNPSISLANGYPVLSWTGKVEPGLLKMMAKETVIRKTLQSAIIRRGPVWGDFQIVGSNVNYTNNNSVTSAEEKTVIT